MSRVVVGRRLLGVAVAALPIVGGAACSDGEPLLPPPQGVWSYAFQVNDGSATCGLQEGFLALDADAQTITGFADGLLSCIAPGTIFEGGVSSSYTTMGIEGSVAGGVVTLEGFFGGILTVTHGGSYTGDRMEGDVTLRFEDGSSLVVQGGTWHADRDLEREAAYERVQGSWAAIDWRAADAGPNLVEMGYRYEVDFDGPSVFREWSDGVVATSVETFAIIENDMLWIGSRLSPEVFTLTFTGDDRVALHNTDGSTPWEGTIVLERTP